MNPTSSPPRLPRARWLQVVRDAPLVSIDLILIDAAARVLLGLRENEPARGTWFVPGGAVRKGETLDLAFTRIAHEELGLILRRGDASPHGVWEHFYDTNFARVPGLGTHYVVMAYRMPIPDDPLRGDRQHRELRWFNVAELMAAPDVHENVKAYFR